MAGIVKSAPSIILGWPWKVSREGVEAGIWTVWPSGFVPRVGPASMIGCPRPSQPQMPIEILPHPASRGRADAAARGAVVRFSVRAEAGELAAAGPAGFARGRPRLPAGAHIQTVS